MKVHLFKNLIKEAVREVLKEELSEILSLANKNTSVLSQPQKPLASSNPIPLRPSSSGTKTGLNEILEMTKRNMTRDDISNFYSEGGMVSMDTSHVSSSPAVGVDLSNLDFVSKAASIYKLSNEKDKNR